MQLIFTLLPLWPFNDGAIDSTFNHIEALYRIRKR